MKKLMTTTLMALILVGTLLANVDPSDINRNKVLLALSDRDSAEPSFAHKQGGTSNRTDAAFNGMRSHYSGYYQVTNELLY